MPLPLIVCITGMPGAGKTTVAQALKENGFKVITMGDVVREEAARQGLEQDDVNLGKLMLKLRKIHGPGAIAYLVVQRIMKDSSMFVAVDGLRSVHEVDVLRKHGIVKILGIHAPKETRFRFLTGRKRKDAPKTEDEFLHRDKRELDVGIGEAISYADSIITNDGTIKELQQKALEVVSKWRKEVEKGSRRFT
ncbi:MAG: AAA family ATPase [Nitrososphaerales archaeon]